MELSPIRLEPAIRQMFELVKILEKWHFVGLSRNRKRFVGLCIQFQFNFHRRTWAGDLECAAGHLPRAAASNEPFEPWSQSRNHFSNAPTISSCVSLPSPLASQAMKIAPGKEILRPKSGRSIHGRHVSVQAGRLL